MEYFEKDDIKYKLMIDEYIKVKKEVEEQALIIKKMEDKNKENLNIIEDKNKSIQLLENK